MSNTFSYTSEVYFDELDGLGFLHHTRYLLHLERAQQKFFEQLLGVPEKLIRACGECCWLELYV